MNRSEPFTGVVARSAQQLRFVNKRLAHAIEPRLPQRRIDIQRDYDQTVAHLVGELPRGSLVVDFGAGRESAFARARRPGSGIKIIGVDVLKEELEHNQDVDEMRVTNVEQTLPFDDQEVDLVVSRMMLEHLKSTDSFIEECSRILKPNRRLVFLFSSRFAPFAIANRLLPEYVSDKLLRALHPESAGKLGFRAFYNGTYASGIRQRLDKFGFSVERTAVSFYQSGYYSFFFPLYVVSAIYELIIYYIGLEDLAAKVLVVGKKE